MKLPATATIYIVSRAASLLAATTITFGLNVWIFQTTGSYTTFALLVVAAELPVLMLSPFMGWLVDAFPRKQVLICSEILQIAAVACVGVLNALDWLKPSLVAVGVCIMAISRTTSFAASAAGISTLVQIELRSTVNGYLESCVGVISVVAPLLAVTALEFGGLWACAAICALAHMFALANLVSIDLNEPVRQGGGGRGSHENTLLNTLLDEYMFGFRWIWQRPDLRRLTLFFMAINLGASVYIIAYTPYILSFASSSFLSYFAACVGAGLVVGGVFVGGLRRIKRQILVIVGGCAAIGLVNITIGISRESWLLLTLAFCWGACVPVINATNQTIWQSSVPEPLQGRVYAARRMIGYGLKPFTALLSIPVVNLLLTPLIAASFFGISPEIIWGADEAAPLGLLISLCGVSIFLALPLLLQGKLAANESHSRERMPIKEKQI